ncbi:hypothetical protein ANN_09675, partial [Periplaneta americana]
NLVEDKLDPETPFKSYLIYCKPLEQTNHATVSQVINNGLNKEKVLVLYSDAASYMLKAAGALSVFYCNMISPCCMQCYKKLLLDVPLPSQSVITRWGTWIKAVNFFNKHFEAVKLVVETFSSESASAVPFKIQR